MEYGNSFQRTSPIVLNLIIINALVFFAQGMFAGTSILVGGQEESNRVYELFALHHYKSEFFRPYQIVTHMFMHGSFMHLLFNMLGLWMFGSMIERIWGPKRFLTFYLICGLAAAFTQMGSYAVEFANVNYGSPDRMNNLKYLISQYSSTVGASGAIMGVTGSLRLPVPEYPVVHHADSFSDQSQMGDPGHNCAGCFRWHIQGTQ
ncbi:MAG: rhomboid family intramembrane serine protease [Ferruginibacter sp.]